jgi:AcrR family transcriptional regulator
MNMAIQKEYKTAILDISKQIIETEGFESLTITNLVKRCKISRRTFYNYFSSKEDLISSINASNDEGICYAANLKERIIRSAMKLFCEFGYSSTDMNLIARTAEVNKGSIYKYFSSKEDLLKQCILYEIDTRKKYASMLQKVYNDPMMIIIKFVEYNCDYTNGPNAPLFALCRALSYKNREIKKCFDEYIQHRIDSIVELIESGKRNGTFRNDADSKTAAKLFVSFFSNISLEPVISLSSIKDDIINLLNTMLRKV